MVNEPADYGDISFAAFVAKAQGEMTREVSHESAIFFCGNKTAQDAVRIINGSKSQNAPLVEEQDKLARFEQSIMPHMNAAYNLARWLSSNDSDARDIVQEAYLRAFKFFSGFRGGDSRSWLLRIVSNAFYDWLKHNRREEIGKPFEDVLEHAADPSTTPDASLLEKADNELLHQTISELPLEFREILVLRELEGFSYKEISAIASVPLGTVMSRLARAREHLRTLLVGRLERGKK